MALPVWADNLIAYSLQMAILASAGTLLAYVFRLRQPRVALAYWQVLLAACLLLPVLQSWNHPVFHESVESSTALVYALPAPASVANPKPAFSISYEWIGLALVAGTCLRLLWLGAGFFRLRLFLRKSRPLPEAAPVSAVLLSRIGVRARFCLSHEIDSPAAVGLFSPTVILPGSFDAMTAACREAVVCHELLHVRRRDWAVILLEEIIRSIYWFHPAVWWLLGRIHLAREQAVDHEVVQLTGSRQPYLDSLLEIARSRGRPRAVPAPLFLRERHLAERVALLLKEVSMNRLRLAVSLGAVAVLLTGTVVLAADWFPLTGEPQFVQLKSAMVENVRPAQVQAVKAPVLSEKMTVVADPAPAMAMLRQPVKAPEAVSEPVSVTASAPQRRDPIRVGSNIQESKLIRKVAPVYPELAKKARVSGRVILVVTVDEEGMVTDVQVSSGHPLLSEAAIEAVRQWRYSPTLLNDQPVPVIATVSVIFSLDGDNPAAGSDASPMPPMKAMGSLNHMFVSRDSLLISRASPIDEKGSASAEEYRAPEVAVTPEGSLHWVKLAEAGWPADIAKGTPLSYSFIIDETGALTNFTRVQGPEIPELEREVSQMRILSPGQRGSTPVRSWCIYEVRIGLTMEEIQRLMQASYKAK